MKLLQETTSLLEHITNLKTIFYEDRPQVEFKDKQFFNKVKEYAMPIHELLSSWEANALAFLKQDTSAPVHPHQIVSTCENIELIIMHSHYADVKEKRYMELNISINYVLGILSDYLKGQLEEGALK